MAVDEWELFEKGIAHATSTATGSALDAALAELGWTDAFELDERAAVATLFEAQGRDGATSGALDHVLAAALDLSIDLGAPVVLPPLGRWHAPGRLTGDELLVRGLATAAGSAVVVATRADGTAALVDVGLDALAPRVVRGMDPALGLVEIGGARGAVQVGVRAAALPTVAWDAAVAAGQRALAHELVGASKAMLALARDHAVERIQFGRPIASFQAVRHRLADSLVAIETASAALDGAWLDPSPLTASVAKAVSGRSARLVGRHAQQVLAGIGFTAEHPLHRYVKRTLVLDRLLGDARSLTRDLGERLLASRELPAILPP
jgi:hypothetical protein